MNVRAPNESAFAGWLRAGGVRISVSEGVSWGLSFPREPQLVLGQEGSLSVDGLPAGTVTFLFTDLEGSTRLWEEHPREMKDALARHNTIVRTAVEAHNGVVFSTMGDGMAAVFSSAHDAVHAVAAAQVELTAADWGPVTGPLAARMGLLTDEGVLGGEHYLNQPLNRCARLMAAAHGGQALVSGATEWLVRDAMPEGCGMLDLGEHHLRDLTRPTRIFQLTAPGLRRQFPPLRSLDAPPGNLPVQLSSFVGRVAELAGLAAAVRRSSLVTVTGVGGVGKTRLALQAAAELLPSVRDGVWLCELHTADEAEMMTQVVMAALRMRPRAWHLAGEQHCRVPAHQKRAPGARQLRAPAERGGCPRSGRSPQLPGGTNPGDEPTAARRGR